MHMVGVILLLGLTKLADLCLGRKARELIAFLAFLILTDF